jgi:hypothetical protein
VLLGVVERPQRADVGRTESLEIEQHCRRDKWSSQ